MKTSTCDKHEGIKIEFEQLECPLCRAEAIEVKYEELKGEFNRAESHIVLQEMELEAERNISSEPIVPPNEMLKKAIELTVKERRASVSFLQRKLGLSYSYAHSLIEKMESLKIISGFKDNAGRTVLISFEDWQEKRENYVIN